MAQTTVNNKQAFGIEGEFYDASVRRAEVYVAEGDVTIGKPVWQGTASGKVTATKPSTGAVFAGIAVRPKEHVAATLTPTLVVPAGSFVTVADMGRVIVKATAAKSVGASAATEFGGGVYDIVPAVVGELAVVKLG